MKRKGWYCDNAVYLIYIIHNLINTFLKELMLCIFIIFYSKTGGVEHMLKRLFYVFKTLVCQN